MSGQPLPGQLATLLENLEHGTVEPGAEAAVWHAIEAKVAALPPEAQTPELRQRLLDLRSGRRPPRPAARDRADEVSLQPTTDRLDVLLENVLAVADGWPAVWRAITETFAALPPEAKTPELRRRILEVRAQLFDVARNEQPR